MPTLANLDRDEVEVARTALYGVYVADRDDEGTITAIDDQAGDYRVEIEFSGGERHWYMPSDVLGDAGSLAAIRRSRKRQDLNELTGEPSYIV